MIQPELQARQLVYNTPLVPDVTLRRNSTNNETDFKSVILQGYKVSEFNILTSVVTDTQKIKQITIKNNKIKNLKTVKTIKNSKIKTIKNNKIKTMKNSKIETIINSMIKKIINSNIKTN